MKNPTIIFFGNTKYSTIGARIIHSSYPLSLIVTKKLTSNPVKQMTDELGIPVIETNQLDEIIMDQIKKIEPDFLVVEDFGLILPTKLLEIPKYAPLNIHHSLLPQYRGPSPAPAAILNGDKISGVTVIKMTQEVDAGDILAQQEYELTPEETTDSLLNKLNEIGGKLLVLVIKQYLENSIQSTPQDPKKANYTKQFTKEDGYFDIDNPPFPEVLDKMIRAYHPWPGVWTRWSPSAKATEDKNKKIVKFLPEGLMQMEGKKAIPLKDFLNGYPDFPIKNIFVEKN